MSDNKTKILYARSLYTLPEGGEIRRIVQAYLDHLGGPVAFLRKQADAIEAGAPPVLIRPIHEDDELLVSEDYQAGLERVPYRCSEAHYNAVSDMATLCNLSRAAVIRAALHWWWRNNGLGPYGTTSPS